MERQVSGTEQFMKPMGQALDSFLTALALLDTLLPADKLQQNNIIILIEHDLALIHSYMQDIDTGFRLSLVILRNWLRSRTSWTLTDTALETSIVLVYPIAETTGVFERIAQDA